MDQEHPCIIYRAVSLDGDGHAAYIYHIFQNGKLPETNHGQFYHPPLFHWLAAQVMKFYKIIFPEHSVESLFEAAKIVSCFASCSALIFIKKICEELQLEKRATVIVVALMAFFPNFYLMAGRVNNDSLTFLFMVLIVFFAIRWYRKRNVLNIIGMGLSFGLGMMTKINVATMAFVIGPVMLWVLYKEWKNGNFTECIKKYIIFVVASFPLGLWYPVRNLVKFGQSLAYVLLLDEGNITYRGGYELSERLIPKFKEFVEPAFINYMNPDETHNFFTYLFKSAMFGEFSFEKVKDAASVLLYVNMALIVLSLAAMVYLLVNKETRKNHFVWGLFSVWAVTMVSYISFGITYPFSCSMDFRYVPITGLTGAVFLGMAFDKLSKKETPVAKVFVGATAGLTVLFGLYSMYIYAIV